MHVCVLQFPLNFVYLKGWIRQAWIPLYGRIPGVLSTLDIIVYTVIIGSVVGAAYYAAALVITRIVDVQVGSRRHCTQNY